MLLSSSILILLATTHSVLSAPPRRTYNYIEQHDGTSQRHPTNELEVLFRGNNEFQGRMKKMDPEYLDILANDGQKPPFMFLGCSDSRVSEGTIFSAKPGTIFSHRNIANQFHIHDPNANSIVSYAIAVLGVKHVIVMGHYGCGGIAAAMASPPQPPLDSETAAVQAWISPIRELYAQSVRPEIVEFRSSNRNKTVVPAPTHDDPAFRALIEENVKDAVQRIARTSAYRNHLDKLNKSPARLQTRAPKKGSPVDVFIHGWIFDVANGKITDLGVSIGPPGKKVPKVYFPRADGPGSRNLFGDY